MSKVKDPSFVDPSCDFPIGLTALLAPLTNCRSYGKWRCNLDFSAQRGSSSSIRLSAYNRILSLANGIAFPKTSPNSGRVFRAAPARLRMRWMCPGAVIDIAPGITLLFGGVRSEAFASRIEHIQLPHSSRMSLDGSRPRARRAGMTDAAMPSTAIRGLQSDQPLMKHVVVEVAPATSRSG
jgi:hypothetical protein